MQTDSRRGLVKTTQQSMNGDDMTVTDLAICFLVL